MKIDFFKYQGAGNDFILLDNRNNNYNFLTEEKINTLCNRRFGIGADGLMLLENHPDYDFEMQYFNADGKIGSMCGNGGRCIVAFAHHLGIIKSETNFLAVDGPHYAKISSDPTLVDLQMIDVNSFRKDGLATILNTGSPHYVLPVTSLNEKDVFTDGQAIRYNAAFNETGINVNFTEWVNNKLFVRTYERGVEDETYACGTGVTAAAIANAIDKNLTGRISTDIKVLGGLLNVKFNRVAEKFTEVFLQGPAELVFKGEVTL